MKILSKQEKKNALLIVIRILKQKGFKIDYASKFYYRN